MKLNNLQILRGISALLVCCFHFREDLNFENLQIGTVLFQKGSIGVPIFFVISGFIMAFTTRKLDLKSGLSTQISSFYKKRVIRIIPLYFLLTFLWMFIGGNFLLYFQGEYFSRLIHSLLFIPQKDVFPILYLGWSLNFEMFFYLIFGISLIFKANRYFFIVAFFIATYFLGLIFQPENAYLKMVTSNLNLYFVVGILFSLLLTKFTIPKKYAFSICFLGISAFAVHLFNIVAIENELLVLLIISLFVVSFLLFDFTFKWGGNKFFVFLGDISYSLYLSHPFVEIFFRRFKVEGFLNVPYFFLKIAIVIAVAAFFYHFIETKVTNYLKTKLKA